MVVEPMGDTAGRRPVAALLPIMSFVFVVYLIIGMSMPVLPLHVHHGLGFGTFMVGVVAGSQFAAALVSRPWAGHLADRRGGRVAVVSGLLAAAGSGLCYLASLAFAPSPDLSVKVLLLGRLLLGGAESILITGALSWGLALLGPRHTGQVMAWIGTAIYAAYAVGAPLGTLLYSIYAFRAIALATALLPLGALGLVLALPPTHALPQAGAPLRQVLRAVWLPGLGLAISGVGFGAITTFTTLLYVERGWGSAWMALSVLSLAFMAGRTTFGHLPDRLGGAKVALVCVIVESVGLAAIWLAPWPLMALAGVALSGLGYSLVYPGLGVEALRRAPIQGRGLAMGTFTAFLDLSLGVSTPALGWVAGRIGLGGVFLTGSLVVLSSAVVTYGLLHTSAPASPLECGTGPDSIT